MRLRREKEKFYLLSVFLKPFQLRSPVTESYRSRHKFIALWRPGRRLTKAGEIRLCQGKHSTKAKKEKEEKKKGGQQVDKETVAGDSGNPK